MTATTHEAAIATITTVTTTDQLADALATWIELRDPARPGSAAGVPHDAPDGHYTNGYHLLTKTGGRIQATAIRDLPDETLALWQQLDDERRDRADVQRMADEVAAERRGPGQPRVGRPIQVRLPDWLITALDEEAAATGTTRAKLVRDLIQEARAARRQPTTEE